MPWLKCKVCSLFMRNNEGLNWKPDHVQISIVKFFGDWKWNGKMFNKNSKTFLKFTFLVSSQSCVLFKVVDRNSHIIIKSQKMSFMEFPKVEGDPIAWWWESPINFTQGTWFTFSLQNNLVVCTWFEKNIFAIFSQLKKFAYHPFFRHLCVDVWIQEKTWFGSIFW